MSHAAKTPRLLPFLHLLAMVALTIWWTTYFWANSPSREVFRLHQPTRQEATQVARRPNLMPKLHYISSAQGSRLVVALHAALGDIIGGAAVLILLGVASGVYVRRLDTWLGARTSGQAVAFRGQDLTAAALDANASKQRGILR